MFLKNLSEVILKIYSLLTFCHFANDILQIYVLTSVLDLEKHLKSSWLINNLQQLFILFKSRSSFK